MHRQGIYCNCFLPPNMIRAMEESDDPEVRRVASATRAAAAAAREIRMYLSGMPRLAAIPSPAGTKHRLVYDMEQKRYPLPGKLIREEGGRQGDSAVNEAYKFAGTTYDFFDKVFNRNSLDNRGMSLISSVHYGRQINNAFWNGEQMLYGDGDGRFFLSFTKSLDVVAHELTHGVVTHTSNLEYQDESGALNEHFADAMSAMVKQWSLKQTADQADWMMGAELLKRPPVQAKCVRTFKPEKAYENDPVLGTDGQVKHMRDKYTGPEDYGGVHINSGIPNVVFYLIATELGGHSWEKAGKIWYSTLLKLTQFSNFQDAANITYQEADIQYGTKERNIVKAAWKKVGVNINT
jgi:Zn-dependent metalloprotease